MRRRAYLATVAVGATIGAAGCTGGEAVHSVNRSVSVEPGEGYIETLPPATDKLKYIVTDDRPFDVYVFTDPDDVGYYETFVDGARPRRPAGDRTLGGRAIRVGNDAYQRSTKDKGRESIGGDSPSYFVLDNSGYRHETVPGDNAEALSAMVDLEAVKSKLPF